MRITISPALKLRLLLSTLLRKLSHNIPTCIIFLISLLTFYHFVYSLVSKFLQYNTTVLIRYEVPNKILFPSFTICGCSVRNVTCIAGSEVARDQEKQLLQQYPLSDILDHYSFAENELISKCSFIFDSQRPEKQKKCASFQPVIQSIIFGRKCFTYFNKLNDDNYDGGKLRSNNNSAKYRVDTLSTILNNTENTDTDTDDDDDTEALDLASKQINAYIYLEINFTQFVTMSSPDVPLSPSILSLSNSDVMLSIHTIDSIPTMHENEFYRIDPSSTYNFYFGKQITRLMPPPYKTKCRNYDQKLMPRSKNECVNLCTMMSMKFFESITTTTTVSSKSETKIKQKSTQSMIEKWKPCLNYYNIIRHSWLKYFEMNQDGGDGGGGRGGSDDHQNIYSAKQIKYCSYNAPKLYLIYIMLRYSCRKQCNPDCLIEEYDIVYEITTSSSNDLLLWNRSSIIIEPNKKMYEIVEHTTEINVFELIGTLGGHAHIWMGISAIQLYDIAYKCWLYVYCFVRRFIVFEF